MVDFCHKRPEIILDEIKGRYIIFHIMHVCNLITFHITIRWKRLLFLYHLTMDGKITYMNNTNQCITWLTNLNKSVSCTGTPWGDKMGFIFIIFCLFHSSSSVSFTASSSSSSSLFFSRIIFILQLNTKEAENSSENKEITSVGIKGRISMKINTI